MVTIAMVVKVYRKGVNPMSSVQVKLTAKIGFYKPAPYLQACSRSPQISAGLFQVSSGLCRPIPGLSRSLQAYSGSLQVSVCLLKVSGGFLFRSLQACYRILQVSIDLVQVSAGLIQVFVGLNRPTLQVVRPTPGLFFRSLCIPFLGLSRSLQVSAGLLQVS